jgi:hypothetical protein
VDTLWPWRLVVPVVGAVIALSWPFARYAMKVQSEAAAVEALDEVRAAQTAFRSAGGRGGFATSLDSLTTPCNGLAAVLAISALPDLASRGYEATVRPRRGVGPTGVDCHGRPTAADYYVGVQPVSSAVSGQRAYAATAKSEAVAFFDGVAPSEEDFGPGGLAVPVSQLTTFRIP